MCDILYTLYNIQSHLFNFLIHLSLYLYECIVNVNYYYFNKNHSLLILNMFLLLTSDIILVSNFSVSQFFLTTREISYSHIIFLLPEKSASIAWFLYKERNQLRILANKLQLRAAYGFGDWQNNLHRHIKLFKWVSTLNDIKSIGLWQVKWQRYCNVIQNNKTKHKAQLRHCSPSLKSSSSFFKEDEIC